MQKAANKFILYAISAAVLAVLVLYTYVEIFAAPYMGFHVRLPGGEISKIYDQDRSGSALRIGDRLLHAGEISWEAYYQDLRQPLFGRLKPGDQIILQVARGDQEITIPWVIRPPTWIEITDRLDMIWLPYVFWAAGTATLMLVRPRDTLWRLLVAFNYLTAIWLVTGITSYTGYWRSAIVMRMAILVSWPVYWHLHWHFPKLLGRLPAVLVWGFYAFAGLLAIAQWFQLVPPVLYNLAFALAILGSVILLAVHAIRRPEQRRDLGLLTLAVGLVVLPLLGLAGGQQFGEVTWFMAGSLLALPGLPMAYFYAVYRRQNGELEPRANRVISLILFGSLLFIVAGVLATIMITIGEHAPAFTAVIAPVLVSGLIAAAGYPWFQKWVERRLLRMPSPPVRLLERYSARIVTSLNEERLVSVIRDDILPTLLIRQAALLRLSGEEGLKPILSLGLEHEQLPEPVDLSELLEESGKYRPHDLDDDRSVAYPWARLILPLRVDGREVGVCLFGKRDFDDSYSSNEIPTLQALMDQTALALINIEQAGLLRKLNQVDISRQEAERTRLAHELHDDVLNQMSMLALNIEEPSEQFQKAYAAATMHIRQIITGLRPTMLNYGLYRALEELVDEAYSQEGSDTKVVLDLPKTEVRYPHEVELHLYRIVQQACQNALKHAQASEVHISGRLEDRSVELFVSDNGKGFNAGETLDLAGLLADKHFGLAWMYERAALFGAQLRITSALQKGTRVRITWHADS